MTSTQAKFALQVILAVAETIRETSPAPAGILYASLMQHGCTMTQFEAIIGSLKNAGLVTEKNHLLTWTGPKVMS